MKTRHQLVAEVTKLKAELVRTHEEIRWLHSSITERNTRAERAERAAKASGVAFDAIHKLYVDGG